MSVTAERKRMILLAAGVLLLVASLIPSLAASRHEGDVLYRPVDSVIEGEGYDISVGGEGVYTAQNVLAYEDGGSTANVRVNINTASAEELAKFLPGVGETRAQAIVEYRETVGGFGSVEELLNVRGIGKATYAKFYEYCAVDGPRIISVEPVSGTDEG